MYRCQNCGERFEQFEVLGQCPHCHHLSKVKCNCGHTAEGWDFVRNNDCCPKCGRPIRLVGGSSEHNLEKQQKETRGRIAVITLAVVSAAIVLVAVLWFLI